MTHSIAGRESSNKPLLVAFETYPRFADAASRLKELTFQFGSGGSIRRSESGFAVLATAAFLAQIATLRGAADPTPNAAVKSTSVVRETTILAKARLTPLRASPVLSNRVSAQVVEAVVVPSVASRSRSYHSKGGTPNEAFNRPRLEKMALELRHAFQQLPPDVARSWTGNIAKRLGTSFTRRVGNVVDLGIFVLEKTGELVIDLTKAIWNGRTKDHVREKALAGAAAGAEVVDRAGRVLRGVLVELRNRPAQIAPELLVSSLAFFVVGGGFDGDGGVPDLDIEIFGIGGHRSIFSHSIVAGTLIETSLYSLLDLVTIAHSYLPKDHDPHWDAIHLRSHSLAGSFTRGASGGLAYHLAVDSIIQPAAYHDLPFPAPIEAHQGISGANAASEAVEATRAKPSANSSQNRSSSKQRTSLSDIPPATVGATQAAKVAVGGAVAIAAWFFS